ncbi:hypothetical protein DID88_000573 [Monilinia fructigena]|uniref:Uncharacterized protein n=1 Tax=Monilinia fructigena TaxID=38457 RepID=A0A395IHX7_9HELO|nr:hypothetical protein DID88_000573 [Monilinia fructigena]
MVYCSGSIGMDVTTKKLVEGGVADRTRQSLLNLQAILEAAGSSIDNVVKVNVFLTKMEDFAAMNKVYAEFFHKDPKPVRTCVAYVDSDDERTPGQADESVLFQTLGRNLRSKTLVGKQILSQTLSQDRRNKAQHALATMRSAGDQLMSIRLLSSLASSPVTNTVPASAASQQVAENHDLPWVPEVEAADGPTARNQVPIKRQKWFRGIQSRPTTLDNIEKFMPIQYEYPPHPEEDRSNEWFQNAYAVLFERILVFSKDYFGLQELQQGFHEPWVLDMPDEFLRILEVKVFASNLWGNTKEGEEFLHGLDRALLASEGYSRQQLRSKSIRTLLGGASLTPNFHVDCLMLTAQVMLLFAPLFNYLTLLPAPSRTDIPLPTALHQSLHNIISSAAYLSICIRISPTIIHLSHLAPGTPYSPEEHTSIMQASWTLSKTLVQGNWTREHALLETQRAEAEGYKFGYEHAKRLDSKAGRLAIQRLGTAQSRLDMHRPPWYTHRG